MIDNNLVFVDVETVGLELEHDIWEVAYAIGDGPIKTYQVPHSLQNADPKALELNKYWSRFDLRKVARLADVAMREEFTDKTLVGANPAFDAYRLARRWGVAPWHYRLLDVESMAVQAFHLLKPEGLTRTVERLRGIGYDIPGNDHTAAADVESVRAVYATLMEEQF